MYDFVAIDFETANYDLSSACSLGIVAVKDLQIVEKKHYYIKPPTNYFQQNNIKIHGITYDHVKECAHFDCLWEDIRHYFDEIIIAHNAQFDMSVLKNCLGYYNIEEPNFLYMDSITIGNISIYEYAGNSLQNIADAYSIEMDNHHNALSDAITCASIVIEAVKRQNIDNFLWFSIINEVRAKLFSELKSSKSLMKGRHSKVSKLSVKISELQTAVTEFDYSHPLYGKNCVLTGDLNSMERKEAMQGILDVGGIVKSSVSKKTDYLIVGVQDKSLVGKNGLSSKQEKALNLIESGCGIKIIVENEFVEILKNKKYEKGSKN